MKFAPHHGITINGTKPTLTSHDLLRKTRVSVYLTDTFTDLVGRFEQYVRDYAARLTSVQLEVHYGQPEEFTFIKCGETQPGYNPKQVINVMVLRVLHNQLFTFLLTTCKYPVENPNQLYVIVVAICENQAPFFVSWKKNVGLMSNMLIRSPYLEIDKKSQLQVIRVLLDNTLVTESLDWRCDINVTRKYANELFNNGDYIHALFLYELCLAYCHDFKDNKTRAILYTNSAVTFYKLRLYENALRYTEIASGVNRDYFKAYVWRIRSLMERKMYGEIPNLLVVLKSKTTAEDFSKLSDAYSMYLANSLGMYNWKSVVEARIANSDKVLSEYMNKNIGIQVQGGKFVLYALAPLPKHSLIMISKAAIYEKKGSEDSVMNLVTKSVTFQKSFYRNIGDVLRWSRSRNGQKIGEPLSDINQLKKVLHERSSLKNIFNPEGDPQEIGIWFQLYKLEQSCSPNCTIIHFDDILVVSAEKSISKGETLTYDIAAELWGPARKTAIERIKGCPCECPACSFKHWENMQRVEQKQIIREIKDINLAKQTWWYCMFREKPLPTGVLHESVMKLLHEQINWADVLLALQWLRRRPQNHTFDEAQLIYEVAQVGIQAYLKMPRMAAIQLVYLLNQIK